jgi:integrase
VTALGIEVAEGSHAVAKAKFLREFRQRYVAALLAKTGGNVAAAARIARTDPSAFRRLMRGAEVSPRFNWPLDTIRRRDIARWIDGLKAKRAADKRGRRALSWQTVKHCRTLLSGCLGAAVDDEIIERNPAAGIRLERPTSADAGWTFLTPAEQERLLSNAKIPEAERVIMGFAIATGLRQGEQWCLELRDLHVAGADPHVFVRWGSPGLPPKNGKTRRVSLTGNGLAHAKRWLELLPDYLRRQNGRAHYENQFGLVFPTLRGHRRRDGKPPRAWKTWLALAKLSAATDRHDGRPVRWHDLRHTCASSLIAGWWGRAWRIEEIREHLGHSSIKVTERYAHLASTVLQAAAAATPGLPTGGTGSGGDDANRPKTVQASATGAPIEAETKGAPHWIRTSGLRLRRPTLYPAELVARTCSPAFLAPSRCPGNKCRAARLNPLIPKRSRIAEREPARDHLRREALRGPTLQVPNAIPKEERRFGSGSKTRGTHRCRGRSSGA